jgi:predicted NUDIX family NTP pyrophosphohydrolase
MASETEVSAGLVVFRRRSGIEVLLGHPGGPFWAKKDEGVWSIPKGIVESGDLLACARREFLEETGLAPEGEFLALEPVRRKDGKVVHAWAVEADLDLAGFRSNTFDLEWPPRSGRRRSFPEIDRIAYFDLATARRKIHPYQRPLIEELARRFASASAGA